MCRVFNVGSIFRLRPMNTRSLLARMKALPHTHSCFVCGASNPIGLKLRFETDGRVVRTRFTPTPEHIGFKGVVHGGILSTLLDEIMVWACVTSTQRFAFCAELNVRFIHPAHPAQELQASAELVTNRRNRIFEAKAELRNPAGELLVTATGKYCPVKETALEEMVRDFVDDPAWLTRKQP
jgi:uncharacterized protein (TIGR00369 family)